jgi:tRNA A-37 threonylcarbamoyl transferase component Bud32
MGSLGEKIGEGATADIHVWAPGQVLKLSKLGVRWRSGRHEAQMTRAAYAAGLPAPEVLDEVTVEGRFGMVLRRLDGPTLLQLSRTGAMTPRRTGAILATLCLSVHKTSAPPGVLSLRDWVDTALPLAGDRLPKHIATGVLTLIDRLPAGGGLCHGDLHPGNVIMTAEGPRLIDWAAAMRAPGGLDLGWGHVLLSEFAPEIVADPERPRAVNAAVQSAYARLTGISPTALTAAIEPYLPIARVLVLLAGAFPAQRERLIQRIETTLRPE